MTLAIISVPFADEIFPGLWVGVPESCDALRRSGQINPLSPDGFRVMCVLEGAHIEDSSCFHCRVLDPANMPMVDPVGMDQATDWIARNWVRLRASPVLVHCGAGMERSPLTVACYMRKHWGWTLDEAYRVLMMKRTIVADRQAWLPKGYP